MSKKVENEQEVKHLAILLRTMTNGYMLEVNNEGYMYFDAQSLLEGFCIHVGMERLEAMTKEEIKAMVKSLKDGSIAKKLQAEVTELKALISEQKKEIREQKREIKDLKKELNIID
jgi:DNA-binding transcriptional MerR regulator